MKSFFDKRSKNVDPNCTISPATRVYHFLALTMERGVGGRRTVKGTNSWRVVNVLAGTGILDVPPHVLKLFEFVGEVLGSCETEFDVRGSG